MDFDLLDVRNLATTFDPEAPTGDPYLDARYENHRAQFGHGKPYWRLFWHLCRELRPGFAVELGAWQGTCAAHMAAGGAGTVLTVDHHTDPGDDENERLTREAAQRYANLLYVKAWTWDAYHDARAVGKPVDLLFIDAWHHYQFALLDYLRYKGLLADRALVVCDDILDGDSATIAGMRKFWDEVSWGRESVLLRGLNGATPMGFLKWERT